MSPAPQQSRPPTRNAFEVFDERPRPWLDPAVLKAKFLKLTAELHPDRVHHRSEAERQEATQQFAGLNAAYLTLCNPRERLHLLLEMERGARPAGPRAVPSPVMDLSLELAEMCRALDAWFDSCDDRESSPLLVAQRRRQLGEWSQRIEDVRAKVRAQREQVEDHLRDLDTRWMAADDRGSLLESMEDLAALFAYVTRWTQQLEERILRLKTLLPH